MNETPVLIVGAGPTGLALALFLARAGVRPRIIETHSGPGQASRAMAVHARTLEFYRQLGFADEVVDKGIKIENIHWRVHGHLVSEVSLKDFGEGLSPYPFVLSFPQDDHERLLLEHLTAAGISVEWETELHELEDTGENVRVILRKPDGTEETTTVDYLCGCDGARSTVRQSLKLDFAGGTYDNTYFVADVEATGNAATHHNMSLCLGERDFLLVFPIRRTGSNRLIGIMPLPLKDKSDITFEDIRPYAEKAAEIQIQNVNWFSTYRSHHRVAEHFRVGRVFILGDAGHIHSPVGGQGMNTGIGDAVNLAWKLAAVVQGRADNSLLETYEPERITFAHLLVDTTDRGFQVMISPGIAPQLFREALMPHLAPFLLGFSAMRTAAFRLVSQTRIHYRASALSKGAVGEIHGGDRLPWIPLGGDKDNFDDNFVPLKALDWQIHIYGTAESELRDAAQESGIAFHEFAWSENAEKAGLTRDALYLIRPDGYIALANATQDVEKLKSYLARFGLVSGSPH